jgi:4-methylaminobutanoate oxidase (formaldehyde-forming)
VRSGGRRPGVQVAGDGRVTGVRTDKGDIEAETVVDCGGMVAAEIGRMAGVRA